MKLEPPVLVQMFIMTPEGVIMTDESVCLDARLSSHVTTSGAKVRVSACNQLERQKWIYHKNVSTVI
jgi:polypeptide N-acetylgalactosaminyltransferase